MSVRANFFPRFKQVVGKCGSNMPGERHSAIDKACSMCDENDISFLEALDGAFGASDDLRDKLAQAESDRDVLAREVDELRQRRELDGLNNETARLLDKIYRCPQTTLVLGVGTLALRFWMASDLFVLNVHKGFWMNCLWALMTISAFVFSWTVLFNWALVEQLRNGTGSAILKGIFILAGIYVSMSLFSGNFTFWRWYGLHTDLESALWVLLAATLVASTNLFKWLAETLAHSDGVAFKTLRALFA
jgi:hypothetical protein